MTLTLWRSLPPLSAGRPHTLSLEQQCHRSHTLSPIWPRDPVQESHSPRGSGQILDWPGAVALVKETEQDGQSSGPAHDHAGGREAKALAVTKGTEYCYSLLESIPELLDRWQDSRAAW